MLCRLVVEQAGGYLRRIRREPSHALRTLLKGVLHAMRIAQYRNSQPFTQFVLRLYEYVQAVGAQRSYDYRSYDADHEAAIAKRVRHRQNPRAETSFQQMNQGIKISERKKYSSVMKRKQ